MPKTRISEYSTTNSDNTDIESINIAEGCAPSGINNAIRELMVHLKEFQTGASGDAFTFAGGVLISGSPNTITGAVVLSNTLSGVTQLDVDNIRVDGNTISSTDTNGNITLAPNGTGAVVINDSQLTLQDETDNTKKAQFQLSGITTGNTRTYTMPNVTGTIATISNLTQTFSGSSTFSNTFTLSQTTQNIALGTSQTTGTWTAGGASQTGTITLDQSTKAHTLNIGTGATENATTKTINIGTAGVSGSTTAITIGSTNGTTTTLNGTAVFAAGAAGTPSITTSGDTNTGIFFPAADTIAFTEGGVESMRIDSSGNVGIGTTSPSNKLAVSNGGANGFEVAPGASETTVLSYNRSTNVYTDVLLYGGNLRFFTAPAGSATERARITSGGALCVGGTGNIVSSSEILSVSGITGIGGTGSTTLYRLYVSNAAGSNATSPMIRFSTTDGIAGTIISTTTSTTYATSSDYRLKENIAPMTGALDKVAQLNPVTYNWKSNGLASQGFIAHELQAVCPDAVTGKKDETEIQQIEVSPAVPATYDEDGNELTPAVEATYEEREVPVYQGVDTSFLVATLTAAIQELKAITDAQATRIEALEAEVAAMKANNGN